MYKNTKCLLCGVVTTKQAFRIFHDFYMIFADCFLCSLFLEGGVFFVDLKQKNRAATPIFVSYYAIFPTNKSS